MENELDKQQKYFDGQAEKLEMEVAMLKEFTQGYQRDLGMKEE